MIQDNRVIMISGANRGIGQAIAKQLYEDNFTISLGARTLDALTKQYAYMDIDRVLFNEYDAKIELSAKKWVDSTINKFGKLDGLINNAGILKMTEIDNYQEDILDEIWEVNVKGPLRLTSHAFKYLKKSGNGRVLNMVSLSGKRVKGRSVAYALSKFALMAFTHSVRFSGWDDGIRATALCPSWVNTDMVSSFNNEIIEPKDMTQPEDIAKLVSMLLNLPNTASVAELCINCTLESSY